MSLLDPLGHREAPVAGDERTAQDVDDLDEEDKQAVATLDDVEQYGLDVVLEEPYPRDPPGAAPTAAPPAGPLAARYLRRQPYPGRQPRSRSSAHCRRAAIKEGYGDDHAGPGRPADCRRTRRVRACPLGPSQRPAPDLTDCAAASCFAYPRPRSSSARRAWENGRSGQARWSASP